MNYSKLLEDYTPVLDKERLFLFVSHNKVAQTSINRNVLKKRVILKKNNGEAWKREAQYLIEDSPKLFTFTIVRNPYDRILSAFSYLKKTHKIKGKISFEDYVMKNLISLESLPDPHFLPQYRSPSIMEVDYIGKLETIEESWKEISQHISNVPATLPKKNTSSRPEDWREAYTQQSTLDRVYKLYENDFKNFDYQEETI